MRELHWSDWCNSAELEAIAAAYKSGPAESVLRRVLVADLFSWMGDDFLGPDKGSLKKCGLGNAPEFMLDLVRR